MFIANTCKQGTKNVIILTSFVFNFFNGNKFQNLFINETLFIVIMVAEKRTPDNERKKKKRLRITTVFYEYCSSIK